MADDSVISTETFTHDAAGNITSAPDTTFAYDINNRLVSFNGNAVSFIDPFELRVVPIAGAVTGNYAKTDDSSIVLTDTGKKILQSKQEAKAQQIARTRNDEKTESENKLEETFSNVITAISNNVGGKISLGKEITEDKKYYFVATVEEGTGYNKDFGEEKPVNFFASAGENWWEFWEWSVGIDVNFDGYGFSYSIGTESAFSVHMGNVSHEISYNSLGRYSYKITYSIEDVYKYEKYSLNMPEIGIAVIATYYTYGATIPLINNIREALLNTQPISANI